VLLLLLLLPHKLQALEFLAELEDCGLDKTGYAFMTGGRMMGRSAEDSDSPQDKPDQAALKAAFLGALDWFEKEALTR